MKEPEPLDVVLAGVRVGRSTDPRPCIVLDVLSDGSVLLAPCSSQRDLFRPDIDFWIDAQHQDFRQTGLKSTSYVIHLPPIRVERKMIKRVYGRLAGELADAFGRWYGW